MLEVIAGMTGFDGLAIGVKAVGYAALLVAAGSVLCPLTIEGVPLKERRLLARLMTVLVGMALALIVARLMLEAVFLAGDQWSAALDWPLLTLVGGSALGQTLGLQGVGAVLLLGALRQGMMGVVASLAGVALIAVAFPASGHVGNTATILDNALLVIHMLALIFWVGVFVPLYRLSAQPGDAAAIVADDFGRKAIPVVAALIIAGVLALQRLTGGLPAALQTPYGQLFAAKLAVVAGVLALAALNRRIHTPALQAGRPGAGRGMRRSLALEGVAIGLVILISATFTTLTGPVG